MTRTAAIQSGRRADTVVAETLATHPGHTATELAQLAGLGASTVTRALAVLETAGRAQRHIPDTASTGGRRPAAHWHLTPAAPGTPPSHEPSTATRRPPTTNARTATVQTAARAVAQPWQADSDDGTAPGPARDGRLGKGELASLVLEYLLTHPGDDLGPTAIGKALARSQGAVANCLSKLTQSGDIHQSSDKPRRYRLAS